MTSPYVNPIGKGLQPARIDMGVDYTGAGPLYAMGSGTITNVYNSGWPGGTFIGLKLDSGQYAGDIIYYAENIATSLKVGQHVSAGEQIGTARGAYPYTEIGWAAQPGTGQTMAAASGQASTSGDPGAKSTAYGVSMSDLIASLGGPAGIMTPGGVTGSVSGNYPSSASTTAAAGLSGCLPLVGVIYLAVQSCKSLWRVEGPKRGHRRNLFKRTAHKKACDAAASGAICGREEG